MRRVTLFVFVVACTLLALYTSAGCSGGIDQLALQNLESGAINTCGDLECFDDDIGDDTDVDTEDQNSMASTSAYEAMICEGDTPESPVNDTTPFEDHPPYPVTTGNSIRLSWDVGLPCGKPISPPVILSTHEPMPPFQPVVFCGDTQIPLENPHSSCSDVSDISSSYVNIPAEDFGVCVLKIDDEFVSTPYFVYRNNGTELTRYEILRTCIEKFSCSLGTFRSAAIPLIEAASESEISSDDITFTVFRTVDGVIVEASDMGNLSNAALLLEGVDLTVDDDVVSHNNLLMNEVITFIEDSCIE